MTAPTRAQVAVLKSLQNQTVYLEKTLEAGTRQTGQPLPPSWYEDFHARALLRDALTNAAHAGGVPRAWIDHVRQRGQRGILWRGDLYLRAPEPVDWDRILDNLTTDVQRIREWTALDVAYRHIYSADSHNPSADLTRRVHDLHTRTAAVANLLGLTAEDGHQLWGTTREWAHTAKAMLDGVPTDRLIQRWHEAASADTHSYALQTVALSAAKLTVDTAAALPSHEQLVAGIGDGLTLSGPLFRSAVITGANIDTATAATGRSSGADVAAVTGPAVFSHAPRPDHVSFKSSVVDIPAPEFRSVDLDALAAAAASRHAYPSSGLSHPALPPVAAEITSPTADSSVSTGP